MSSRDSISVVLPAFNEAQNLVATVNDAILALKKLGRDYEILVVDDGSTDKTPEICRELVASHSSVRVVRHEFNRGYGAALCTGFQFARCDLVFITDADGQFRFNQLGEFLACIDTADAVIGYRVDRQDCWHRKLISRVGNGLVRKFLGAAAKDIDCAYKLFRRAALLSLPLKCDGAMISTELLALGCKAGWKIEELPVVHFARRFGKPTGARPFVIWRIIVEFIHVTGREEIARRRARIA